MIFIILGFCINAEKFSDYIEVSEPEYVLIYEAGGLYIVNEDNQMKTMVMTNINNESKEVEFEGRVLEIINTMKF